MPRKQHFNILLLQKIFLYYIVEAFPLHRAASGMTSRCVDLVALKRANAQRVTTFNRAALKRATTNRPSMRTRSLAG
jgi:hypothetical protein